jgi:hypothetical protein
MKRFLLLLVRFKTNFTGRLKEVVLRPKFKATMTTDESPEIEEHVRTFGRENFGKIAIPYLTPYVYNKRFLDKQYVFRKEADCTFLIGDEPLTVDRESNITIYGKEYRGTLGLWELLTRKSVNKDIVTIQDMKAYKNILDLTNADLEG